VPVPEPGPPPAAVGLQTQLTVVAPVQQLTLGDGKQGAISLPLSSLGGQEATERASVQGDYKLVWLLLQQASDLICSIGSCQPAEAELQVRAYQSVAEVGSHEACNAAAEQQSSAHLSGV
jgi:hypothetical protein